MISYGRQSLLTTGSESETEQESLCLSRPEPGHGRGTEVGRTVPRLSREETEEKRLQVSKGLATSRIQH